MTRREAKLTKKEDFVAVYEKGRWWANSLLVMKVLPNERGESRYGFTVSRNLGKSVRRNRVKRLLREIVRSAAIKLGWDIVFIARPPASIADYYKLGEAVTELLARADLLEVKI